LVVVLAVLFVTELLKKVSALKSITIGIILMPFSAFVMSMGAMASIGFWGSNRFLAYYAAPN